jgi:autotransporter-associated beta strand protein
VTLSGANACTGNTTVNAGTLAYNCTGDLSAIHPSAMLTIAAVHVGGMVDPFTDGYRAQFSPATCGGVFRPSIAGRKHPGQTKKCPTA